MICFEARWLLGHEPLKRSSVVDCFFCVHLFAKWFAVCSETGILKLRLWMVFRWYLNICGSEKMLSAELDISKVENYQPATSIRMVAFLGLVNLPRCGAARL